MQPLQQQAYAKAPMPLAAKLAHEIIITPIDAKKIYY